MIIKNVPAYSNSKDDTHCFQAALKMILGYFEPDKKFSWKQLDKISAKKKGLWTWPMIGLIEMKKRGYEIINLEKFDYEEFIKSPKKYLTNEYGESVAKIQIENSNIAHEVKNAQKYLREFGNNIKLPTIKDIKEVIDKGFLIGCNVNSAALNNEEGYIGHFVVIFGYDKEYLYLHDPGLPFIPNLKTSYQQFKKAWEYPNKNYRNVIGFKLE